MIARSDILRMLCWEGYQAPSIVDRFRDQSGFDFQVETLLSDVETAERLCLGELEQWDILNINNAYIRDYLHPRGLIKSLQDEQFDSYLQNIHPVYESLLPYSFDSEDHLIGIGQRFGPFNLVVNSDAVSVLTAQDQGFELANDESNTGRFGILDYPDFNVFHVAIGAGLNPFKQLSETEISRYSETARSWYQSARYIVDDHHFLNQALINREIDFYISGGIYTASPARLDGNLNIQAITPRRGPIEGKGGIVFSEITSVLNHSNVNPSAQSFLQYMLEAETATDIAFVDGTCNPVAQMGDPDVFNAFSKNQLNAIQWEQLESDLACCACYQIPPQNIRLLEILARTKEGLKEN